jgi:hypothetical protein
MGARMVVGSNGGQPNAVIQQSLESPRTSRCLEAPPNHHLTIPNPMNMLTSALTSIKVLQLLPSDILTMIAEYGRMKTLIMIGGCSESPNYSTMHLGKYLSSVYALTPYSNQWQR